MSALAVATKPSDQSMEDLDLVAAVESTLFRARRRLSEEYEELVSGERCVHVRAIGSP